MIPFIQNLFFNLFYFLTYMYQNYNLTTHLWPSSFQLTSQNTNDPGLNDDILPIHISQSISRHCPHGSFYFVAQWVFVLIQNSHRRFSQQMKQMLQLILAENLVQCELLGRHVVSDL